MRTGQDFVDGLRARPRDVWVEGVRVDDVTAHPAFSGCVRQLARLYDAQFDPSHADTLTCALPNGERVGTAFMPSRSREDLEKRRRAYQVCAEMTLGRSPDFMNVTLLAFAEARAVFDRGGTEYGDRVVRYYEYVRDNDLFLSHAAQQASLRVVRQMRDGIIVSGARMIAALGAVSDEMIVYGQPADEDCALIFAVPTDVPGLRQICRETDSLLIFKDVFVPWDRVFCYRNIAVANAVHQDSALRHHRAHQAGTRALVKLRLVAGLARAIEGEALDYVEMVQSALVRAEVECEVTPAGTLRPALPPLQALRGFLAIAYPRVIEILRKVAGGAFKPTGADLASDEIGADAALYCEGPDGMASVDRERLFRLAWDLAGDLA